MVYLYLFYILIVSIIFIDANINSCLPIHVHLEKSSVRSKERLHVRGVVVAVSYERKPMVYPRHVKRIGTDLN